MNSIERSSDQNRVSQNPLLRAAKRVEQSFEERLRKTSEHEPGTKVSIQPTDILGLSRFGEFCGEERAGRGLRVPLASPGATEPARRLKTSCAQTALRVPPSPPALSASASSPPRPGSGPASHSQERQSNPRDQSTPEISSPGSVVQKNVRILIQFQPSDLQQECWALG